MRTSDRLFELIHALTKSEKRHFKIHSSLHTGNKIYVKLFDLIEKQKQYDEVKLKSHLKIKGFPVIKVYLYHLILKSLRMPDHQDNEKKSVVEYIENAENLLKKGLYKHSYSQLVKAKKIAKKFQYFSLLIEIYQLEHAIANSSLDTVMLKKLRDDGEREINFYLSALKEQSEYRKGINLLLFRYNHRGKTVRNTDEKNDVDKEVSKLLNKNPDECLSFKGKVFHYNVSELYYYFNNNFQEAYNQSNKALLHFESDIVMLNQELKNYLNSMNNLMNSLQYMKKYPEMMGYINKMKNIPISGEAERIRIFAFAANRQILYYNLTEETPEPSYISHIEKELIKFNDKLNRPAFYTLCCNVADFYFRRNNFREALRWNNKIIHHPEIKSHYYYNSNALLAEIMLHFELNNFDTCESLINSYQSFMKNAKPAGKFEPTFLKFFKRLSKTTHTKKNELVYQDFLKELRKILSDPFEFGIFDIFDLEAWLIKKIEKI